MTDRLEQERAAFHDFLMRNGFAADTTQRLNGGRGDYRDPQIHAMWCGWLGRAKQATAGVALDELPSVTLSGEDAHFLAVRLRRLCAHLKYTLPKFAADDASLVNIAGTVIGALLTSADDRQRRVDIAIRQERRAYFANNPPNTWLAQVFNDLLAANGTFEPDAAKNAEREGRAIVGTQANRAACEVERDASKCWRQTCADAGRCMAPADGVREDGNG